MLDRTTTGEGATTPQPAASAADPRGQGGPPPTKPDPGGSRTGLDDSARSWSGADELLQFRLGWNGTTETLYVSGELDISSGPSFERAAASALDGQGGAFHVDFSGLTFMDSTGALSLVRVHERVERVGRELVLMHPSRPVRRVLELLGLDRLISVEQ